MALQDIPFCSALKEIRVAKSRNVCSESRITLDDTFIIGLGKASEGKKLPNLTSMTIDGYYKDMSQLFQYKWPTLTHLVLFDIECDEASTASLGENILPPLVSLEIEGNYPFIHFTQLSQKTNNMQKISLASVQCKNSKLIEAVKMGHFSKLQHVNLNNPSGSVRKLLSILDTLKLKHISIKHSGRDLKVADFVQHKAIFNLTSLDLSIREFPDGNMSETIEYKEQISKFGDIEFD